MCNFSSYTYNKYFMKYPSEKAVIVTPEEYAKWPKEDKREARLYYIIQYYQWIMKTNSLNSTQAIRYITILREWQRIIYVKKYNTEIAAQTFAELPFKGESND